MVFITAANSRYYRGLKNLVGSIHFWAPDYQVIIYDIGLHRCLIKQLDKWKNTQVVLGFLHQNIPDHCKVVQYYAWKPLIIHHALQHHESVLWTDAGSDFRAPITMIQKHLEQDGHFFVQGQDIDMTQMSHDGCYQALGTKKEHYRGKPHFAGGLQGYMQNGPAHTRILNPFCSHALNSECIAPKGSNLSNHRFDQTLLSIVLYQSELPVIPRTNFLSTYRHELNADPEQPSQATVYTARRSSREYIDKVNEQSLCIFSMSKKH